MTFVLSIEGMSCEHCVQAVTKALMTVSGVTSAQVDLGTNSARIESNSSDPAPLVVAVEEEGYRAKVR